MLCPWLPGSKQIWTGSLIEVLYSYFGQGVSKLQARKVGNQKWAETFWVRGYVLFSGARENTRVNIGDSKRSKISNFMSLQLWNPMTKIELWYLFGKPWYVSARSQLLKVVVELLGCFLPCQTDSISYQKMTIDREWVTLSQGLL